MGTVSLVELAWELHRVGVSPDDIAERVLRAEVVYATRNEPRRTHRQAVAAALAELRAEAEKRGGEMFRHTP